MIDLNAYFLQSNALASVTKLFKLVSADEQTAETSDADAPTVSAGGVGNAVSGQVADVLLALKETPTSEADKPLPPGWSKYGSPGVRGWESLDEISDPEDRAFFIHAQEVLRVNAERLKYALESFEYKAFDMAASEREAARLEVNAVRDQFGIDSIEYRDALDLVMKQTDYNRFFIEDLAHAKAKYDSAKDMLAHPTYVRLVSYRDEQGVTRNAVDANGRAISEVTSYTQDELAAAQTIVDDYRQTIAETVRALEKRFQEGEDILTGHVMVQDDNGEYQWSAFSVAFKPTGNTFFAWSADGVMTSANRDGDVVRTYAIRYRDAADPATKTWSIADLKVAKAGYESAKDMLAHPTDARITPDQLAAAQAIVDDYPRTMAEILHKAERDIQKDFALTGHVMVQDQNGEYQWGAFSVANTGAGRTYFTRSADGIVTGYGSSGAVTSSYALR